jgi:cytoskeletal protein CcmA (bactofilin family)
LAIFSKTDQAQPQPPERAAAGTTSASLSPTTLIGPKVRFVGDISGDEDILVQGRFEGNIEIGRKVTVAASGEVRGDVHARSIVVGGRVHGQIRADERAELLASASVQGDVHAPKVVIAEGAQLQGNVAMAAAAAVSASAPAQNKVEEK